MAVPLNPNGESSTTTGPSPDEVTGQQTNDSKHEPQPGSTGSARDDQVHDSANPEKPLAGTSDVQPTESGAWHPIVARYETLDRAMIKGYNDEIGSLLIFAGLFSAILAAFIVQSNQLLQQDSAALSASILANISLQIGAIQSGQQTTGSIQPSANSLDTFHASRSAAALNILWYLSLVFSLASAFFGILVKQGLREYLTWLDISSPLVAVRVRQFRFEAFVKWYVSGVVGALPVLLEIGVVFFMCGLLVLLWTLHRVVAIVITIPVALFLLMSATVTLLPVFSDSCPFKSPVALSILSGIAWPGHYILRLSYHLCDKNSASSDRENPVVSGRTTWKDRDLAASEASEQILLWRSVLGFYSSPIDDTVQLNAEVCLRALINQPPKRLDPSKEQQDSQSWKVELPWKPYGLADLLENVLDCDKSTFSIFCKYTYGSGDMRWQNAVSSFGTTDTSADPRADEKVSKQVIQKIQRLPPTLVITLNTIIIKDLCNIFDSGAWDLIAEERETLIFACCFLCSLRFASRVNGDYMARSRFSVLRKMVDNVGTFPHQNHEQVPIHDLFAWLLSDETVRALTRLNYKRSLGLLYLAINMGARKGDDALPPAGAIMALSMRGLEAARYATLFPSRDGAKVLKVVPQSIRLIEDTMKLSVTDGIINCGTPSLKGLEHLAMFPEYLADFSQPTSPPAKEVILLGIRRGIFTWSVEEDDEDKYLSLTSLLKAYNVDPREQVECAKLQKIFIHGGPLPEGGTAHWRPDRPYFVDHNSKSTTWMDPRSDPQSHDDPSAMRDDWFGPLVYSWEKRSYTPADDSGYIYFSKDTGKDTQIDPRHSNDVKVQERWQSEGKLPSYDESAQITESSELTATLGPSTGDIEYIGSDDDLNSGGALPPQHPRIEHNVPGIREDNLHGQENAPHTSVDIRLVDRDVPVSADLQFYW